MATFVSNRDSGGRTDEEGHYKFWNSTFVGEILKGEEVVQNSPSTNMNVRVSEGILRVPYSDYAYQAWSEGYTLVPISTSDTTNPRIDRIVAYIDRSILLDDSYVNNPGVLKYKAVAGSPNAVPVAPNDAAVISSVGATNPWVEIATVAVAAAASTIVNANITDTRVFATAKNASNSITLAMMTDGSVGTSELVDLAATTRKMKPTYQRVAGNNGGSRQTYSNSTITITGTSMSYTSGPTNEVLWISGHVMASLQPGSQVWVQDGTTPISKSWYAESGTAWRNYGPNCFFEIAANTTKTFSIGANGGGGEICNSSGDQAASPSFGVELKILSFGRT